MRSPLEKGAAKGRDRLPRRGRTLQNGKDMGQQAPQPKFESRLLLFPVYEASKVKEADSAIESAFSSFLIQKGDVK